MTALALPWFALLASGYDLGQLVFGLRVLFSDVVVQGDAQRTLAFAGTSALTALPTQLGGALGLIGSVALLARWRGSVWLLLVASLCLCWPLLVWIVVFAIWRVLDALGSALLLTQILITLLLMVAMPIVAWRLTPPARTSLAD